VEVGAVDPHACRAELSEHVGMGVAVVVVAPRADDRIHRAHRGDERGIAGRPAVMRHLEEPGPQRSRLAQQKPLGRDLGVTGQEHPPWTLVDPQDQRHVVDLGVAAERPTAGRGQDGEPQ
jgi:hypothetical protein